MKAENIARAENLMGLRKHYKQMLSQATKHKKISSISMSVDHYGVVLKAQHTNIDVKPIVKSVINTIEKAIADTEKELKSIGIEL